MALNNLPVVFSKLLKDNLYKNSVFLDTVSRDYEGDAKVGSTVQIRNYNKVSIVDYDNSNGLGNAEDVADNLIPLLIDNAKAFNVKIDDLEEVKKDLNLASIHMNSASKGIALEHDTLIATQSAYAHEDNYIGTDVAPVELTQAAQAYDLLVDLGVKLDEQDVDASDRFAVISPAYEGLLRKDPRFTATAADEVLRSGIIGYAAGFTIKKSNNLVKTEVGVVKIMAYHKSAIGFAEQFNETETLRSEKFFADIIRGLSVYGAKVIEPKALAVLNAKF